MVNSLKKVDSKDDHLPNKRVNYELLSFLINDNSPQWLIILTIISIKRGMKFTSKNLLNSFVNIIEKEDREELDDDDIVVDFDDLIVENDKSEINNSQFKSKIKEKNKW